MLVKDLERFAKSFKVVQGGCWEWQATVSENGYGRFCWQNKQFPAHRLLYELVNNQVIDKSLHTDHLCRNRRCVNPYHLEPVTAQVNILRGNGVSAINARKTHCKNGHEFTTENTYISYSKGGRSRDCIRCKRLAKRRFDNKHKELQYGQA